MIGPSPDDTIWWTCICDCGTMINGRGAAIRYGRLSSCGCAWRQRVRDSNARRKKGEFITYTAMHLRLSQQRGPARTFWCLQCDSRADEWAYDDQDESELFSEKGHRYSLKPEHYIPLCVPCHRKIDGAATQSRRYGVNV